MRRIHTALIVSGESTTTDAATRSRYPLIHVNKARREGNYLPWLQDHRDTFHVITRFLLRHREQFIARCMETLAEWLKDSGLERVEERARLVYGVPYSAFVATARLLKSHLAGDLERFRKAMINQAIVATDEVQSQTDVAQFFEDFYAVFISGGFGNTASELKRYLRAEPKQAAHPPGAPNQNQIIWGGADLYLKPRPVLDVIRAYKRVRGQELRINQLDLRRQLATKPCWIAPKKGMHRKIFDKKTNEGCWGIDLDRLESGYEPVSEEEWLAFLEKSGLPAGSTGLTWNGPDPRHGDLFAIVHRLLAKE
jgi:hypothetical protein